MVVARQNSAVFNAISYQLSAIILLKWADTQDPKPK
jgi:hypothetical protein